MLLKKLFGKRERNGDINEIKEYVKAISENEERAIRELEKLNDILSDLAKKMEEQ